MDEVARDAASTRRWSWPTRVIVSLLAVLVMIALLARDYVQAQQYALLALVILQAEDAARTRARVRALAGIVEELTAGEEGSGRPAGR